MPSSLSPTVPVILASISDIPLPYYVAPVAGVAALATAVYLRRSVMGRPEGEGETVRIAQAVREGGRWPTSRASTRSSGWCSWRWWVVLGLMVWAELEPVWAMVGVPIAGFPQRAVRLVRHADGHRRQRPDGHGVQAEPQRRADGGLPLGAR
ncbi:MAG: hypothetical protein KatS3mg103_1138 [Phycisphaerales bacterium]|nr:MAG: hypothetical protein KatS3mg103_1138 [Phycisphaerales bacterium]